MQGVFLHVLADSLSSLGVIISTILVKYYQVNIADPICSFLIAAMILTSGIPFIKLTLCQLVLQSPPDLIKRVNDLEKEVKETLPCVESIKVTAWSMTQNSNIAQCKVQIVKKKNKR